MLVVRRKQKESISVGDFLTLTVVKIYNGIAEMCLENAEEDTRQKYVLKKGDSIKVCLDVVVVAVDIYEDFVRLGCVAPKQVPVHRKEVYDAIRGPGKSMG